jgi:hypothetical protein
MPLYSFRLSIFGQLLDKVGSLELADRDAAEGKAHQLARALLSLADSSLPWAEGELVVECGDGSDPITLPIGSLVASDAKPVGH